jgi:hypothetical protein
MLVTIDKTLLDCSFQHTGMYLGSLEKWDGSTLMVPTVH